MCDGGIESMNYRCGPVPTCTLRCDLFQVSSRYETNLRFRRCCGRLKANTTRTVTKATSKALGKGAALSKINL